MSPSGDTQNPLYLIVLPNDFEQLLKSSGFGVASERHLRRFFASSSPNNVVILLFIHRFLFLARILLLERCDQFRPQPHQSASPSVSIKLNERVHSMLKSFMHPSSNVKPDSKPDANSRTGHPAYASGKPAESPKPAESTKPAEAAKAETAPAATKPAPSEEGSKLIVGPNIKLKGSEITDCEILVVEGRVEASMKSRDIRIAEGGVFSGKAEIDVAEVRGTFEGDLTARKRLVIHATGKVTGVIRYGAMMVEEGGSLSGDVARLSAGPSLAKVLEVSAPTTPTQAPETVQEKITGLEQVNPSATLARNQAGSR